MAAQGMYHAAIEAVGCFVIGATQTGYCSNTTIYIQHPDQRVAENLGAYVARVDMSPRARLALVSALAILIDDAVEAVKEQVSEVTVVFIDPKGAKLAAEGNGDPTHPVSKIKADLTEDAKAGYRFIITMPYDEDRYGDLYTLGKSTRSTRTNACATCGSDQPEFRCKACKTALYCGKACQTKGWVSGHDKVCS